MSVLRLDRLARLKEVAIYKGAYYSISDPTYVGAMTGMCMPDYLHEKPVIECWLGNNP